MHICLVKLTNESFVLSWSDWLWHLATNLLSKLDLYFPSCFGQNRFILSSPIELQLCLFVRSHAGWPEILKGSVHWRSALDWGVLQRSICLLCEENLCRTDKSHLCSEFMKIPMKDRKTYLITLWINSTSLIKISKQKELFDWIPIGARASLKARENECH